MMDGTGSSPVAPPPAPDMLTERRKQLMTQLGSGANWFFWIAALSLVNSIVALAGKGGQFAIGLGITQIIDGIALEFGSGPNAKLIAFGFDVLVAGLFVLFGIYARRRRTGAFVTGIVIYGLDALLFLIVADWLGIGFHGLALYFIINGLKANRALNALDARAVALSSPTPPAFIPPPLSVPMPPSSGDTSLTTPAARPDDRDAPHAP